MRELMQRPQRNTAYWLAPHDLLSLLSYSTQDHLPRDDTYNRLSFLIFIFNEENVPEDLATGQSGQGNSSIEILSFELTLGLCEIDN